MRQGTSGFEREDALVCADVLGGFGVSSDHVRARVADASAVDAVDDLECAIQRALADPEHPTAFLRRTVAASPRGVDSPARFWATAPETQLGDVFAAIDWTFDVRGANGRSLSVDDAEPYRLRVEDADGRTRSTEFSFPDTPLGDDNYPALVDAINRELLYGLECRFVQLSDGTDRWRFALVETEELDRLVEQFGERVTAFDRPLLAAAQPDAYVPERDAESATAGAEVGGSTTAEGAEVGSSTTAEGAEVGSSTTAEGVEVGSSTTADGVPVPAWARESRERSWRGRRLTADAFDADHVGGLDHLADDAADADSNDDTVVEGAGDDSEGDPADAAAAIEFVGDDTAEPNDGSESAGSDAGDEAAPGERTVVRDADTGSLSGSTRVDDAETTDGTAGADDDDLAGWSIGGSVDATTRSSRSTTDDATDARDTDASLDSRERNTTPSSSDSDDDGLSTSGFTWGDDAASDPTDDAAADSTEDAAADSTEDAAADSTEDAATDSSDDGFFSADAVSSFDAGAKTSRVEGDSFGVDAGEQTEDDQFAAVGAAIAAPAGISCRGLLDDDEFLPRIPRTEPAQTRLTFEDEFDPTADPADERETDDGFVWVNESQGLDENRTSASD